MLRQARPLSTRPMVDFVSRHGGIRSRLITSIFGLWSRKGPEVEDLTDTTLNQVTWISPRNGTVAEAKYLVT